MRACTYRGTCFREVREVRGSAFVHSARRELHMAREIAAAGCASANVPLGVWRYAADASPFGDSELLQAACCIERTFGDRRLGTHVLGGLALLLPQLLADDDAASLQDR